MVMYRRGIPLVSQETIAYELGLTVPKKDEHLFLKVHQREKGRKGWGMNISWKKYDLDKGLKKLKIPLKARYLLSSKIDTVNDLKEELQAVQEEGVDILISFAYEEVWGGKGESAHVCVFDKIVGNNVWMIDPEQKVPKFRHTTVQKLHMGIKKNGIDSFDGLYLLESIED